MVVVLLSLGVRGFKRLRLAGLYVHGRAGAGHPAAGSRSMVWGLGPVTVPCESYESLISVIQGLHNYKLYGSVRVPSSLPYSSTCCCRSVYREYDQWCLSEFDLWIRMLVPGCHGVCDTGAFENVQSSDRS